MKTCIGCEITKQDSDFYAAGAKKDRLQSRCKSCCVSRNSERRRKLYDDPKTRNRESQIVVAGHRRRRYGVGPCDYTRLLIACGGRCSICKGNGPLVIDHDHRCCPGSDTCGKCVRALICDPCNRSLGGFRDEPATLRAAADYLERHPHVPKA